MSDGGWVIGLIIYMFGRTTMALGANLQRYSMRAEMEKEEAERRPKGKQPVLVTGVVLYTGSGGILSIALIFASPTLLSPCGTIIFVSNIIFAYYINKEPFAWKLDGGCMLLIVIGTLLVVFAAPKENQKYSNDELIALCKEPSFIAFVTFLVGFILLLLVTPWLLGENRKAQAMDPASAKPSTESSEAMPHSAASTPPQIKTARSPTSSPSTLEEEERSPLCDTSAYQGREDNEDNEELQGETSAQGPPTIVTAEEGPEGDKMLWWKRLILSVSYGALAGAIGALNITFTKSIFSLIGGELEKNGFVGVLASPLLWVIGIGLGCTFVSQMYVTTKGLERSPAMIFVPAQSVTEETLAVMGGLFYFQDFKLFNLGTALMFVGGESLTIAAVLLLARFQMDRSQDNLATVVPEETIGEAVAKALSEDPVTPPYSTGDQPGDDDADAAPAPYTTPVDAIPQAQDGTVVETRLDPTPIPSPALHAAPPEECVAATKAAQSPETSPSSIAAGVIASPEPSPALHAAPPQECIAASKAACPRSPETSPSSIAAAVIASPESDPQEPTAQLDSGPPWSRPLVPPTAENTGVLAVGA